MTVYFLLLISGVSAQKQFMVLLNNTTENVGTLEYDFGDSNSPDGCILVMPT